jgi:hypothetical protein
MDYDTVRPVASSGAGASSAWPAWSVPSNLEFATIGQWDYPASGGAGFPNLRNGVVLAALVGAGLTGGIGQALRVGSGGSSGYLIDCARREIPATSEATWGSLFADLGETGPSATVGTDAPAAVYGAADLVAELKSTLGVSVTDLAAIARVSRQTIYDWIGEGQVSEANYERLLALRQVCLDWQSRIQRPVGRLLHAKNADGRSLLDLLAEEPLNRNAIRRYLDALATTAVKQATERQERNARLALLSEKDQYENALTHAIPAADS